MNSRFSDRLARLAEEAVPAEPDTSALKHLARRRRTRRRVGAAIAVPMIALALVLPVKALMRLGEGVVGGPSGPGELIAFSKQVNEDRHEIWLVRPDGSGAQRIDIPLPMATDPAWSPDGTTIAFSGIDERDTEPNDIYVVNPDGTGFRELTNAPEGVLNTKPSWSPDGTRLVFSRLDGRESGRSQLVVLDLENGSEETVSLSEDFNQAIGPVWSPDGVTIAFTANRDGVVGPYIVDVETGELLKLVPDRHAGSDAPQSPSWSPDGSSIAFEDDGDIFTVSLEDMAVAQLTESPAMETAPSWSPDGRIVFLSGASRPLEPCTWPDDAPDVEERCMHEAELQRLDFRDLDVYVMNADGSGQVQITSGGGVGYSPSGPASPSWQPVAAATTPSPSSTAAPSPTPTEPSPATTTPVGEALIEEISEQQQAEIFAFRAVAAQGLMDPYGARSYQFTYRDDTTQTSSGWRIGFAASDCEPVGAAFTCRGLSGEDPELGNALTDTYVIVRLGDGVWNVLGVEGNMLPDERERLVGFSLPQRSEPSHWEFPAIGQRPAAGTTGTTMVALWVGPYPTAAPGSVCEAQPIGSDGAAVGEPIRFYQPAPSRPFERGGWFRGSEGSSGIAEVACHQYTGRGWEIASEPEMVRADGGIVGVTAELVWRGDDGVTTAALCHASLVDESGQVIREGSREVQPLWRPNELDVYPYRVDVFVPTGAETVEAAGVGDFACESM